MRPISDSQHQESAKSGDNRYRRNASAFVRTPDTTCWYIRLRLHVLPKYAVYSGKFTPRLGRSDRYTGSAMGAVRFQ